MVWLKQEWKFFFWNSGAIVRNTYDDELMLPLACDLNKADGSKRFNGISDQIIHNFQKMSFITIKNHVSRTFCRYLSFLFYIRWNAGDCLGYKG